MTRPKNRPELNVVEGFRDAAFEDAIDSDPALSRVRELRGRDRALARDAWWIIEVAKNPDLLTLASEGSLPPKISFVPRPKLPAIPRLTEPSVERAQREYTQLCHANGITLSRTALAYGNRKWLADFDPAMGVGVFIGSVEEIAVSLKSGHQPDVCVLCDPRRDDPPIEAMEAALDETRIPRLSSGFLGTSEHLPPSLVVNYKARAFWQCAPASSGLGEKEYKRLLDDSTDSWWRNDDPGVFGYQYEVKSGWSKPIRLASVSEAALHDIWYLYAQLAQLRHEGGDSRAIKNAVRAARMRGGQLERV